MKCRPVLTQGEMDYLDEFYSLEVLPDCPEVLLNTGVREERRAVCVNRFGEVAPDSDDHGNNRVFFR